MRTETVVAHSCSLYFQTIAHFRNRNHICLLNVLAHFRIAGAATAGRTIAQEFLGSPGAVNLSNVHISLGIDRHHMWPVELACLAAAASKAGQFRKVLPVDDVDCVIEEISDVHAAL